MAKRKKNGAAQALAKLRTKSMTATQRSASARIAANARWSKKK